MTHIMTHSSKNLEKQRFYCTHCDFRTNHKGSFTNHLKTHSATPKFSCTQCDFSTKWKCSLGRHLDFKHSQIFSKTVKSMPLLYSCDQCDYKTTNKSHMVTHNRNPRVHPQPTSVQHRLYCTKCEYVTREKGLFRAHLKSHTKKQKIKEQKNLEKSMTKLKRTAIVHDESNNEPTMSTVSPIVYDEPTKSTSTMSQIKTEVQ